MNRTSPKDRLFTVTRSRLTLSPFCLPVLPVLSFLSVLSVLNVSPVLAQTSTDLADSLRQRAARDGAIPWSAAHPVEWKDFRGRPGSTSSTAAETASGIGYMLQCRDSDLSFAVLATFSRGESWVRTDVPSSTTASATTLRHERTHFDITELFARRLRQALSSARDICPHRTGDARRTFEQLRKESEDTQKRYDKETAHGTASAPQAAWEKRVKAGLDSLNRFEVR